MLYPAAKQYLVGHGVPAAEVDAMPVPAALARFYVESFEEWWDETLKWTNLPFWEAYPGHAAHRGRVPQDGRTGFASNPLLTLMPSVSRAYLNGAKLDRQIAALQTVEALRHYAATHDGRLPASLARHHGHARAGRPDDRQTVPLPGRGRPRDAGLAGPRRFGGPRDALRVEVTFVK